MVKRFAVLQEHVVALMAAIVNVSENIYNVLIFLSSIFAEKRWVIIIRLYKNANLLRF